MPPFTSVTVSRLLTPGIALASRPSSRYPRLGSGKTHDSSIPATTTPEDPRVGSTIEGLPYDIVYGDLIHEHDVL